MIKITIARDFIEPGMRHRPMTNPSSSLYGKKMRAKKITVHEAWTTATAEQLHSYVLSQRAADRPASWHFSVDQFYIGQSLPLSESGWHAGDGLGPGNTQTIGTEIIDRGIRANDDPDEFWEAVGASCQLHAWIIQNCETLLPFPDCLELFPDTFAQHYHWSGKNCPALLRGMPDGWSRYLDLVEGYLREDAKEDVVAKIQRAGEKEVIVIYDDNLVEGLDPDIDRAWIKENIVGDEDPYQDKKKANYRVIVASYEDREKSEKDLEKIQQLFPTKEPFIALNEVDDKKYYRVVLREVETRPQATTVVTATKEKWNNAWTVSDWEDLPLPDEDEPEPEPEPEKSEAPEAPEEKEKGLPDWFVDLLEKLLVFLKGILK